MNDGNWSELIAKYDVPGPRYTSYPTVPYWDQMPTTGDWVRTIAHALEEGRASGTSAGLYIHVPFCRKTCHFCGCNSWQCDDLSAGERYVETLLAEWSLYLRSLERQTIPLSDIHVGGGTPTFLAADGLEKLIGGILNGSTVSPDAEFSIEVDPRTTTPDHLAVLSKLGFTRISLGIQDFDANVQAAIGRIQTVDQVRKLVDRARELRFDSVNFDILFGLPTQTAQSISRTIEHVCQLRPDRIAFYAYAHVPRIKKNQAVLEKYPIPEGAAKRSLYEHGRQLLEAAGYCEVGMDHFALPTDALWQASREGKLHRNFMGYIARHVSPLIGLGVSSIGDSWEAFAQNDKNLIPYEAMIRDERLPLAKGHLLNHEDLILRRHILNLMTRFYTSWKQPHESVAFLNELPERTREFVADGLIEVGDCEIRVTQKGRPFVRNIAMMFDARLARSQPGVAMFSRTI